MPNVAVYYRCGRAADHCGLCISASTIQIKGEPVNVCFRTLQIFLPSIAGYAFNRAEVKLTNIPQVVRLRTI